MRRLLLEPSPALAVPLQGRRRRYVIQDGGRVLWLLCAQPGPTPNMPRPWGPCSLSLATSQVEYRQLGASYGRPACVRQGQMVTMPIRRQPCSQACWWEGAEVLQKGLPVSGGTVDGLKGPVFHPLTHLFVKPEVTAGLCSMCWGDSGEQNQVPALTVH